MLSPEVTPTVIEELTEALERERRRARQLEIAQEALLERAARRQQLIGRLGHELRTPVTVILGMAQTLQRGRRRPRGAAREPSRRLGIARATASPGSSQRFEAAVEAGLTEWADVTTLAREVAARRRADRRRGPGRPGDDHASTAPRRAGSWRSSSTTRSRSPRRGDAVTIE